jgi:hypothetical protein
MLPEASCAGRFSLSLRMVSYRPGLAHRVEVVVVLLLCDVCIGVMPAEYWEGSDWGHWC